MRKEFVYSDKLLLVAIAAASIGFGGALLAGQSSWLAAVIGVVSASAAMLAFTLLVLEPAALWLTLRNIDGFSRVQAALLCAVAAMLAAAGYVLFRVFVGGVREWLLSHEWLYAVGLAVLLGWTVVGAFIARRERNKLKTIDLSKSRDLTIK